MILPSHGPDLASLSTLDDPVRRRLYEFVSRQEGPVGRDEAAAAAGVGRALAIYHLDKLVGAGLLTASYRRPPGRRGPGAGRPAKLYAKSGREFAVTVPPREYELAARLLVQVVESDPSGRSQAALGEAARRFGVELGTRFWAGAAVRAVTGPDTPTAGRRCLPGRDVACEVLVSLLTQQGYQPSHGDNGVIRLRNCPFHQLAEQHRDVVCGMNLALVEGVVAGLGAEGWRPVLDPRHGHCCVAIGGDWL